MGYTSLVTNGPWWEDEGVFEDMKKVISQLGHLADERPTGPLDGYLAERPQLMSHCIRVWAPCGCCLTYMNANVSVLTQCDSSDDTFDYEEANRAIEALKSAESQSSAQEGENGGQSTSLAIVKRTETQPS